MFAVNRVTFFIILVQGSADALVVSWALLACPSTKHQKTLLGQVHPGPGQRGRALLLARRGPGVLFARSWQQVDGAPGARATPGPAAQGPLVTLRPCGQQLTWMMVKLA